MRWAIVIGIDEYERDELRLFGAVADAERFRDWVVARDGGAVPPENVRVLLGRRADDPGAGGEDRVPTKDNIVTAINEIVTESGGGGERLYVFFAGHGITARVANRDESALVTPGFSELHPDHSLALRSLTEFLETTQFEDQFFFVDACRNVPWTEREFEIGRWPIPRRRDPGKPPVQQFVLYATSPGLTAAEVGWPGETAGAFTDVLMAGLLEGEGRAKAWSWERNCYEVRWENLATYVKTAMEERKHATSAAGEPPPGGWPIQIPQDAGTRGVAGRDRDALLVSFSRARFSPLRLTVELRADPKHDEAEVSVLDAVGEPVASALKVTGSSHAFSLPPKTYAVRAKATDAREGRVKAPVELYADVTEPIELRPPVDLEPGQVSEELSDEEAGAQGPGEIVVEPADPLTLVELRDEAGNVVAVARSDAETRDVRFAVPAGFYRIRLAGPEAAGDDQFVVLSAGEEARPSDAKPAPAPEPVVALVRAAGGGYDPEARASSVPGAGGEPLQWAAPSTVVAVALAEALTGEGAALAGLGAPAPSAVLADGDSGVALYAVARDGDADALRGLHARIWEAGDEIPGERAALEPSAAGVAGVLARVEEACPHWLSLERGESASVLALPVLPGHLATVVAQVDPDGFRLFELHPATDGGPSSAPARVRRVEHLERLLLAGRVDGARDLAEELAAGADGDPFAGCLAGYVLLRLGLHERLGETVAAIVAVAPELADAYILRGEHEAAAGNAAAAGQAFSDAVGAGVPAFAEGLTRLVEGLRVSGLNHPRSALVRHIFQRHVRGSMWAEFNPRRRLEPGRLVVSGADLGFEG